MSRKPTICKALVITQGRFFNLLLHCRISLMGSMFGEWPSFDPHNFTQLRPSDPSIPSRLTPATYHPTHNRTVPPPDQVICTESKNILIRHFYKHADDKMRPKRAASEHLAPENGAKHMRGSTSGPGTL